MVQEDFVSIAVPFTIDYSVVTNIEAAHTTL
jgi:hypothetical protein